MKKEHLVQFQEILDDLRIVIEGEDFSFFKRQGESSPDEKIFRWNPLKKQSGFGVENRKILPRILDPRNQEVNVNCKLCPGKLSPIRSFSQKGTSPILILHYTGEFRRGQRVFTKKSGQVFRTPEAEGLFGRLVKKVFQVNFQDLYFQEFPACIFNHEISRPEDWAIRLENCKTHINHTIKENKIQGIIITGSAAVLYFGQQTAMELTGQIQDYDFGEGKIPLIILRSPEGILHLEEKKKKWESNKSHPEYIKAAKEEKEVKLNIVTYMEEFKKRIGL